jgi:hypothetical protein
MLYLQHCIEALKFIKGLKENSHGQLVDIMKGDHAQNAIALPPTFTIIKPMSQEGGGGVCTPTRPGQIIAVRMGAVMPAMSLHGQARHIC